MDYSFFRVISIPAENRNVYVYSLRAERKMKILYSALFLSLLAFLLACGNDNKTQTGYPEPAVNSVIKKGDSGISTAVKLRIADDESMHNADVHVQTVKGHVTLTGNVSTPDQRQRAGLIAQNVDGVVAVQNNLQVSQMAAANQQTPQNQQTLNPGTQAQQSTRSAQETASDASITAEIKSRLANQTGLSAANIVVETQNGTVTLNGSVKSRTEEQKAVQVARSVRDVQAVRSNLKVAAGGQE